MSCRLQHVRMMTTNKEHREIRLQQEDEIAKLKSNEEQSLLVFCTLIYQTNYVILIYYPNSVQFQYVDYVVNKKKYCRKYFFNDFEVIKF